jgi:hypothetical protein
MFLKLSRRRGVDGADFMGVLMLLQGWCQRESKGLRSVGASGQAWNPLSEEGRFGYKLHLINRRTNQVSCVAPLGRRFLINNSLEIAQFTRAVVHENLVSIT